MKELVEVSVDEMSDDQRKAMFASLADGGDLAGDHPEVVKKAYKNPAVLMGQFSKEDIDHFEKAVKSGVLKKSKGGFFHKTVYHSPKLQMMSVAQDANLSESTMSNETISEPKSKTRTTYLSEAALFETAADGAVNVTLIRPGWSANGRYYSKEALARAVDKFEGSKAYIDHPSRDDERNRPERSIKDIAGYYSNVKQADDGRLVGQLHLVGVNGDFVRPLVNEALGGKLDLIGLSINALGKTSQGEVEGRKGIIVEDIVKGNSTDIVTTPAAGGRFERLAASDDGFTNDLLAALDYDEWANVRPDFIKRLREEVKTLRRDEVLAEAATQTQTLQETVAQKDKRITELEEAQRVQAKELSDLRASIVQRDSVAYADKLLAEARLPDAWVSKFRPQMLAESQTGLWPQMLSAEQVKYAAVRPPIPVHGAGVGGNAQHVQEAGGYLIPYPHERPEDYALRKQSLQRS